MNKLLETMRNNKILVNITTLCVGFKLSYIPYEDFKNYSLLFFLDDSDVTKAIEYNLFESRGERELSNICNNVLAMLDDNQKSYEVTKWLFACLQYAKDTNNNPQELLQKISEIYADFNYPSSMQNFIYYLPSGNGHDPTKQTLEENRARLIKLFNECLVILQKIITVDKSSIVIDLDLLK